MSSSNQLFSPLLLLMLTPLLISLISTTPSSTFVTSSTSEASFEVQLERISSGLNLTKMQIIQRTIKLSSKTTTPPHFQSTLIQVEEEFIMSLTLGTPPFHFTALMDTGSSLIWTQCKPCKSCYAQPSPIFNPNTSSSFSPLPCSSLFCVGIARACETNMCSYAALYGDRSFTQGYLATETFTLGNSTKNVSLPNIAFGCGNNNGGTGLDVVAGIVGLGRGSLSLVSQLKAKRFSYCLPPLGENKKGTLSFGSLAYKGHTASDQKGTPLLRNPVIPSRYYLSLEGISLDDTPLPISTSTFNINLNGTGGVILDSGTTMTLLVNEAYQVLRQEFAKRTRLPTVSASFTGMDLCFLMPAGQNASTLSFPKLKFHFTGMVLEMPKENYLVDDTVTRLVCLGIMPNLGGSIFGGLQQQNFLVLHDLEKEMVSFLPTQCT